MLIHELDSFSGTPTNTDYLVIDDGTETKKIPAPNVGSPVPDAMTQSEAQNGTNTNSRVISPYRLKQAINYHAPIPSAMTANEAEAGTVTETRVISPKVLKDSVQSIITDYVVSSGSGTASGAVWTWRKWKSGKVEAWGDYTASESMSASMWVSPVRYKDLNVSIPSGVFSSSPSIIYASSLSYQLWMVRAIGTSATSINCRYATLTSDALTPRLGFYCVS